MAARTSGLAPVLVCQLIAMMASPAVADQASGADKEKQPSAAAVPPSSDGHTRHARTRETPMNRLIFSDPAVARGGTPSSPRV